MKLKVFIACLSLILIPKVAFSSQSQIMYDKYWSPYSGAGFMISINNAYKVLDDYYLPSSAGKTEFVWQSARLVKLLAQSMLGSFLSVAQHEVFGHGYRGREFGVGLGYEIKILSGTTYLANKYKTLSLNKQAALTAGGLEANTILGQQILNNWLLDGNIDNRDVVFYGLNQISSINYVYFTNKNLKSNSSGNDISCYIKEINAWHQDDNALTVSKMRKNILWDLFDPALYNALYTAVVSYVINAQPSEKLYMLEIGNYKYLPTGRVLMAPYGVEYQLQNYVKTPGNELIQINVRYGKTGIVTSYGLDLNIKPVCRYKGFSVGNKISIWRQPQLNVTLAKDAQYKYGFAEAVNIEYRFDEKLALYGEVGYKVAGYVPGTPLESGVVFGFGVNLSA